jgi:hypothetical protein
VYAFYDLGVRTRPSLSFRELRPHLSALSQDTARGRRRIVYARASFVASQGFGIRDDTALGVMQDPFIGRWGRCDARRTRWPTLRVSPAPACYRLVICRLCFPGRNARLGKGEGHVWAGNRLRAGACAVGLLYCRLLVPLLGCISSPPARLLSLALFPYPPALIFLPLPSSILELCSSILSSPSSTKTLTTTSQRPIRPPPN